MIKKLAAMLFTFSMLSACQTATLTNNTAEYDQKTLVGTWVAKGYFCEGKSYTEKVDVQVSNGYLVATKLRGDPCVKAGEVTWKGRLSGREILGEIHLGKTDGSRKWKPVILMVKNANRIEFSLRRDKDLVVFSRKHN